MEHVLILLAISLILNVFHKYDAELNVIPRDTEVMVNDSTYMNCSTTLEAQKVQWRHGNNYVYAGTSILDPYHARFSVEINLSTGTNNLVIRSAQPSDAGQYDCLEDEGFGERRSAQLIVLDDDPICESNVHSCGVIGPNACGIDPDEIKFSCSVAYHGNIFPILQWKESGDNQSIIDGLSNFTSIKNVTYTLTMKSTLDLSDSSFICQTTRTSKRNYSCSTGVIKILYVFSSNVTIKMTMNDVVSCFANTSQSCSYKWKWFSGNDLITDSNDQILIPKRLGWHRCEATCSIGSKSCTVESMYAEVYSAVAPREKHLLALLALFALPVIVLIVVVIYYRRKIQLIREFVRKETEEWQRLNEERQRLKELSEEFGRKRDEERQRLIAESPGRCFYIRSELNEKVLDILERIQSPGAPIIMWDQKEVADDCQLWYSDKQGIIRSKLSNFVIDSSAEEIVMQYFDQNNPNQAWIVNDSYISQKANPDIVLGIKDSNKENKALICAREKDGGLNQKWKIEFE